MVSIENLLHSLFDSRNQARTLDGEATEPTRLRILSTLQTAPHTIPELSTELSVSRQTLYRSLPLCIEMGLIRETDGQYSLTCAGSILLNAIDRFPIHERTTVLPVVTRSTHWPWVIEDQTGYRPALIDLVPDEPAAQQTTPSRSTIYRYRNTMLAEGYLTRGTGGYELSADGTRFLHDYDHLVRTIDRLLVGQSFLQWLPPDLDRFPIEAIEQTAIITNSPQHPHRCLNAFLELTEADVTTLHGVSTVVSPPLSRGYRRIFERADRVELLFSEAVLSDIVSEQSCWLFFGDSDDSSSTARTWVTSTDLRFVSEALPLDIAIRDEQTVVMAPSPSTGVPESVRPALVSTAPAVVAWALTYFEEQFSQGCSTEVALEAFSRSQRSHE